VSQTRERRIFLHWKALKRRHDYRRGGPSVLLALARRWEMPIREIREVLEAQKGIGS
jgi:hypothetical protein